MQYILVYANEYFKDMWLDFVTVAETGAMVSNCKNPEEHYTYIDMNLVYWDNLAGYWRPNGTVGDRSVISVLRLISLGFLPWYWNEYNVYQ